MKTFFVFALKSTILPPNCGSWVRAGYELNEETGQFVNRVTKEVVTREEALEFFALSEGNVYDLQGKLLRRAEKQESTNYQTEYYLDPLTGEVKASQRPVRNLYVVKKGYRLNSETGQFIEARSGTVVTKEDAIEVRKAGLQ